MESLFCDSALPSPLHEVSAHISFSVAEALAYALFSPLSVVFGSSLIALYLWRSSLLNHPGDLILCQIVCQFVTDLTWMYSGIMYLMQGYIQESALCDFMSLTSSYSIFAACGYNLALSIEVFQKINKPFSTAYSARLFGYHVLTHAAAIAVCLANASTNTYGLTPTNGCFFNPSDSKTSLIPLIVIFGYEIASFGLVFYIFMRLYYAKREIERNILFRHSLFAFISFCLFVIFPGHLSMDILGYLTSEAYEYSLDNTESFTRVASTWQEVACVVSCLAGTVLCSVRLLDYMMSRRESRLIPRGQASSHTSNQTDGAGGCLPGLIEEVLFEVRSR